MPISAGSPISNEGISHPSYQVPSDPTPETLKTSQVRSPLSPAVNTSAKLGQEGDQEVKPASTFKSSIKILSNAFKSNRSTNSFPNGDEPQAYLLLSGLYKKLTTYFGAKSKQTENKPITLEFTGKNTSGLNPIAFARMEKLAMTSNVSKEELEKYIANGRDIANKLGTPPGSLTPEQNSKAGARDVVWYMMYMAATHGEEHGEEHTSGMFRIDDNNKQLFTFINNCDKSPGSYGRISSHFRAYGEHTAQFIGGKQRGLDMGDLKLPGNKHTILFSTLPDGTTFVKTEDYGFPPFFAKGFMNFESLQQRLGHSMDFVKHIIGVKKESTYTARRENTSKVDIAIFKSCMSNLKDIRTKFSPITGQVNEEENIQEKEREGIKYGISQMHESLTQQIADLNEQIEIAKSNHKDTSELEEKLNKVNQSLTPLRAKIVQDKKNGYRGNRQGDEVCLPSFQVFAQMSQKPLANQ